MTDAPEIAWLAPDWHDGKRPEATVDRWEDDDIAYRRADLPVTLAQALALPEVRALVTLAAIYLITALPPALTAARLMAETPLLR